ncbi:MAG: hypothetical protein A2015_10490 [Spirochaetes bacterium GWF1_31_7]|nr:MAG: hypothetical protein A2Y30_16230 [Spirochaetes bacterium GWE1_32_154]OHD48526.1 MAG: hypothetical protein A2Y29_14205 [Spirochaetes bacterium GWE2_31_10]OHD51441.1 MAG: hypothetical protein A2015_10490 [Spirochaetes bacterium GWF1_31_7]HBD93344.1 hypothetical protein [Spirochaetia bacterium]HBI36675.1 hypothetical protein [Spirochaetia bacterium]
MYSYPDFKLLKHRVILYISISSIFMTFFMWLFCFLVFNTVNRSEQLYYYFFILVLFLIVFIGLGIFGLFKLLKPIEKIMISHFQNLDLIIDEKSAKVEKYYSDFLYEKEKSFRYINIVGVILLSLDAQYKVKMINKKGASVLGYSESEIIGKNWFENFVYTDDIDSFINNIQYNNTKVENAVFESHIINNSGVKRIINWTVVYLGSDNKNDDEYILSGEDITERKNLEDQYRQAQKMESIGRLAGGVAHDFNNLLTIIIGNTDILLSEVEKETDLYRDLESIGKAATRAASLTDQLLAFSRKQILKPQVFNVNQSIVNVIKMISRLIGENITIETHLSDDIKKIKADKGQFEQILLNLAVNSRDAMPTGGKIVISSKNIHIDSYYCRNYSDARPGQFVCISFSDSGLGISESVQKNIFEPFYTTKDIGKGTGLGLSVVYGIVKQHEGWINVRSKQGEGTTFNIYLPILFEDRDDSMIIEENMDKYIGSGETILFVEDEEDIRKIIPTILIKKGYNTLIASNIIEGQSIFEKKSKKIDLIITDVVLPDGTGIEMVKKIEANYKNIKVIFSSGYVADTKEINEMTEKGYFFIQKPYSVIELLKLIKLQFISNK